ncbi:hypothetical protein AXI64_gp200 [Vibrio phage qdvp001]|uniref:hypothetical protein n=1 Tax=Vibrio phage qdvp001 TaxID=1003177 RepID=UPI000720E55A|nr:hypothetical protein AXI64_gp200 [Vibrio phage qdvp001]ALM62192.1 hypothetical protein qdvp001_200 [Vibrio phage qdvp001]
MQHKDTIVKNTCLDYVVKQLPKEIDTYNRLCHNHPCERVQWRLVTHLIATLKTLTGLDTELQEGYKELFETINGFEKEK